MVVAAIVAGSVVAYMAFCGVQSVLVDKWLGIRGDVLVALTLTWPVTMWPVLGLALGKLLTGQYRRVKVPQMKVVSK